MALFDYFHVFFCALFSGTDLEHTGLRIKQEDSRDSSHGIRPDPSWLWIYGINNDKDVKTAMRLVE
jgi:hypothetical protein